MIPPTHERTRLIVALTTAVLALALAGCSSPAAPTQKSAAPEDPAANSFPDPEPVKGTPISLPCDALITPVQLSAINPSYTPTPGYQPAPGSHAEKIVSFDGLACAWLNHKDGQTFEVAVAQLPEAAITSLKNEAITVSSPVPTYGLWPQIEGYFKKTGKSGVATIFQGTYWIETSSTTYFEPGDAQLIAEAVLKSLP